VASVQEALMVLGLPAVRTMVLGFSLLSNYRNGACRSFDYNGFWCHSLALALSMQVLAERTRAAAPDELFSAGLLARVGELALATLYPSDYDRVIKEARRERAVLLLELEQRSFAMNHRELTVAMLADWGLPQVFVDMVNHHEDPGRAGHAVGGRQHVLLQSLLTARRIADVCVAENRARAELMADLLAQGDRLGFERDDLIARCERIGRMWAEWGALLQLELKGRPAFSSLAEKQAGAEADPVQVARVEHETRTPFLQAPHVHVPNGPALRVLVVDDDEQTRAVLRAVLEEGGHEVHDAVNGRQGMEQAFELQPHMMVLDWTMPEMGGLDLVRALRQTRIGKGIYMLLLTHRDDDERLIEAFEAGADDFIGKPVKPRILAARLRAGLRVVRLQQEVEHEREELRHFAAELAVSNRRLQEAALTDALTGFPNRRYAIDRIQQEWTAATRWGRPLSCMIIDLDSFKQINDTYGHDVGDEVVRKVADALRNALRGQDVICRTGGDEFLAICPETDLGKALACAERLRAAATRVSLFAGDVPLRVSASIGVATRDRAVADVDSLIKLADQGAYLAKHRGRDRVASVQERGRDADGVVLPG
jgi:diguanylate cyclase (GGDEF)-like protein